MQQQDKPLKPVKLSIGKIGSGGPPVKLDIEEPTEIQPPLIANAPKQEDPSSAGFIKNIGKGLYDIARGIYGVIEYGADVGWKGGEEFVKFLKGDPTSATKLAYTWEGSGVIEEGIKRGVSDTVKNVVDSVKRYENFWNKLYNEPVDVATDLLTVLSLGGWGLLKGAQLAKAAKVPISVVSKLEKAGHALHKFPFGKVLTAEGKLEPIVKPLAQSPVLKGVMKIPGVAPVLKGLRLTPETNVAWKLFNKYFINQKAQATEKDLAEIMGLAKGIPEPDAARKIIRAALKGDPSTLAHPKSKQVYELLKKFNEEQLREKIEFGRMTLAQADAAAKVPMRNILAKLNIRNAVLRGEISIPARKMLYALLDSSDTTTKLKGYVVALADAGVINQDAARLIIKTGKASKYIRTMYAPLDSVYTKVAPVAVLSKEAVTHNNNVLKYIAKLEADLSGIKPVNPASVARIKNINTQIDRLKATLKKPINVTPDAKLNKIGLGEFLKGKDPVYFPLIHQKNLNVWDAFTTQPIRNARQSWMYERTGASGYISDVRTIASLMRVQYRQWQSLERFFSALKAQPFVRDVTEEVRLKGSAYMPSKGNMIFSPDHSLLPFYKDMNAMGEAFARKIKENVGELGDEAFRKAIKDTLSLDIQEIVRRSLLSRGNIRVYEIPIEVGQMLKRVINPPSKLIQYLFETPADLLRLTALFINPIWYVGNLIGNLLFQIMSGVNISAYFRGSKTTFKRIVPKDLLDEVSFALTSSLHESERRGGIRAGKIFTSLPGIRSLPKLNEAIENWSRRVTFMDALTKEAYKRKLLKAGEAMFAADDIIAKKMAPLFEEARLRGKNVEDVILGLRDGSGVSEAIRYTNKWMFDYNNLHPIDRYVMRRLVPFWTFIKNVNLLLIRLPFERPALFKLMSHSLPLLEQRIHQVLMDAIDDDDLPDYLEGHLPIGRTKDGGFIFLSLRGLNPFAAFGSVDPNDPMRSLAAMSNPFVKTVLEHIGGRDVWSKRDLMNDEPMWDWGGRHYAIRKIGNKTVAQAAASGPVGVKGFFTTFANQYPWTKAWRAIMASVSVDEKGEPVRLPIIDEAGNAIYPTPLLYSAIKMTGVNIKEFSPEEFRMRRNRARVKFINDLIKKMRGAPDKLRDLYMEAIKDAQEGNFDTRND